MLQSLLAQVQRGNMEERLDAVRSVRKALSIERNAPIQRVVELGFVPLLMAMLRAEAFPELQFEAAWALTNIASGTAEQTRAVVENGGIQGFVELLGSSNVDIVEQAVWGLGNIAGDDVTYRNKILEFNPIERLVTILRHTEKLSVIRNVTWCIGNFCRGKPPAPLERLRPVLPALVNLLHHSDQEVVTDAAWALGYVTDGSNDRIQAVIEAGAVVRLVELMNHHSSLLVTPALRAVGNIVTGDEHQTDVVIRCGAVPQLCALLLNPKKNIRKEACWAISNITAGTSEQIQTVINAGVFPRLLDVLQRGEFDVKKEAVWAACNALSEGTLDQVKYIVELGLIPPLCGVLRVRDTKMILVVLEALNGILTAGRKLVDRGDYPENPYLRVVEECDGLTIVEELQLDDNEEVYHKAVNVISHFPIDDSGDGGVAGGSNEQMFGPSSGTQQGGFNF